MQKVILNERKEAEALLSGERYDPEGAADALKLISRYDRQVNEYDPPHTASHLSAYLGNAYPSLGGKAWNTRIQYYAEQGDRYRLTELQGVPIFRGELEAVSALPTLEQQCVLFSALAMAKYYTMRGAHREHWIPEANWGDVFGRSDVSLPGRKKWLMLHALYTAGTLAFAGRNRYGAQVTVVHSAGETELLLTDCDFMDLGYAYRAYWGEALVHCERCGRWMVPARNGKKRYCADCQKEYRRTYVAGKVREHRKKAQV